MCNGWAGQFGGASLRMGGRLHEAAAASGGMDQYIHTGARARVHDAG